MKKSLNEKEAAFEEQNKYAKNLEDEAIGVKEDIDVLLAEAETAKKNEKQRFLDQAEIFKADLPEMKKDAQEARVKADKLQSELKELKAEEKLLSNVVNSFETIDTTTLAALGDAEKQQLQTEIATTETRIKNYKESDNDETAIVNANETTNKEFADDSTSADTTTIASTTNYENIPDDYTSFFEQQVTRVEQIKDPIEKQKAKTELYQNWVKLIEDESYDLQNALETTEDATEKNKLQTQIDKLGNSLKKKEELLLANTETAVNNNDSLTIAQNNEAVVETVNKIAEKYISSENNAAAITNEYDRAVTMAELNTTWYNEINAKANTLKGINDTITNEEEKQKNTQVIAELEKLANEKHTKAEEFTSLALQSNGNNSENTIESTIDLTDIPETNYSSYFVNKLLNEENSDDNTSATVNKIKIYDTWANKINVELDTIKEIRNTSTNEIEKQEAQSKITELNQLLLDKLIEKNTLQDQLTQVADENISQTDSSLEASAEDTTVFIAQNLELTIDEGITSETTDATDSLKVTTTESKTPEKTQQVDIIEPAKSEAVDSLLLQSEIAYANTKKSTKSLVENMQDEITTLEQEIESIKASAELASKKNEKETFLKEAETLNNRLVQKRESLESIQKTQQKVNEYAEENNLENLFLSSELNQKNDVLQNEIDDLYTQRDQLLSEAESTKKKDEKERILAQAEVITIQAEEKEKLVTANEELINNISVTEKAQLTALIVKTSNENKDLQLQNFKLDSNEITETRQNNDFKVYEQNKQEYTRLLQQAEVEYERANTLLTTINEQNNIIKANEGNGTDSNLDTKKLKEATNLMQLEADSLQKEAKQKENEAFTLIDKTAANLLAQNRESFQNIIYTSSIMDSIQTQDSLLIALEEEKIKAQTAAIQKEDSVIFDVFDVTAGKVITENTDSLLVEQNTSTVVEETIPENNNKNAAQDSPSLQFAEVVTEIPKVVDREIFVLDIDEPVYSDEKPIPINPELPTGLVYKVQIGAFRNPIPQNLYQGFAPITGEEASNGITRYTAGYFNQFSQADDAKDKIRNLGYSDAFVVAYLDGVRIGINAAKTKENSPEFAQQIAQNNANNINQNEEISSVSGGRTNNNSSQPITSVVSAEGVEEIRLEQVDGLFFTVQIGVYNRPANKEQLYNLSPVNSQYTPSGTIRYSSGIYASISEASDAKDIIVNLGIQDAFVTAYYKGERITLVEARNLLSQNGNTILTNTSTKENISLTDEQAFEANNQISNNDANGAIEYRVQIGAYKGNVPVNQVLGYIELAKTENIKSQQQGELTIYTIGGFSDRQSANSLKERAIGVGLIDAFVVAFKNGQKTIITE